MATYVPKQGEIHRDWWVVDAAGLTLGRLSTAVAFRLMGKHKASYTPFLDTGDHVIVINAEQVHLTGRKEDSKLYRTHSGFMGGLKTTAAVDVRKQHPERLVEEAVRGMLPKTKLGRAMFGKLKVYAGAAHPHQAQKPTNMTVKTRRTR